MEKQVVNEYKCSACERDVKIILTGHNNENILCPYCGDEDIQFMGSYEINL